MRKLVNEVKEKIDNDPPSYHYIITIHCSEKGSLTPHTASVPSTVSASFTQLYPYIRSFLYIIINHARNLKLPIVMIVYNSPPGLNLARYCIVL